MTSKEIAKLESLARKATNGPWEAIEGFAGSFVYSKDGAQVSFNTTVTSSESKHNISAKQARINSEYIAAANPVVVQELISKLKQARKERDWLLKNMDEENCPYNRNEYSCWKTLMDIEKVDCKKCWLQAAKEATK